MTYKCDKCGKESKDGTFSKIITIENGKKGKRVEKFICAACQKEESPLG